MPKTEGTRQRLLALQEILTQETDDTHRLTAQELEQWHKQSGLPLKKFFNTSGQLYQKMGLKDKLGEMDEQAQYDLLAQDGMLVKRPILLLDDGRVLLGFKEG